MSAIKFRSILTRQLDRLFPRVAELVRDCVFYKTETLQFNAVGLLPYAPTRLWAKRVLADVTRICADLGITCLWLMPL